MGRRGPLPSKDGHKIPRASTIIQLQAVKGGLISLPSADPDWLDVTKTAYADYCTSGLVEVVIQADIRSIRDLFDMWDRLTRYEQIIAEDGATYDWHHAETRLHPLTMECHRLRSAIMAREAQLGITPRPREQLKIAVGHATLTADEINRRTRQRAKPTRDIIEAEYSEA